MKPASFMKAYVKLYCKKSRTRGDGLAPIYFSIRIGKQKLLYTGKNIKPELFNNDSGEIINKRLYGGLNLYLEKEKNKLNDIILQLQLQEVPLTFEKIIGLYQNKSSFNSFLTFAYAELEKEKPSIAAKTYADYKTSLNNLKEYAPDISFEGINYQFLREYETWLRVEKLRSQNSRAHNFVAIRKFLNIAINTGLTKNYPFKQFKFTSVKKEKEYLTEKELKELQKLYDANSLSLKLQKTLANFLFTCYTGIAADDMRNKERLHYHKDHIIFERGKTKKTVRVPLTAFAKRMLPEIQQYDLKQKPHRVNEDLKEIMAQAKIKKKITYHAGRHTFAIISLMKGVSLPVISKVLGHTSIKTTEIYARVVDELLNNEMAKWDVKKDLGINKKKGRRPKAKKASRKPLEKPTTGKV